MWPLPRAVRKSKPTPKADVCVILQVRGFQTASNCRQTCGCSFPNRLLAIAAGLFDMEYKPEMLKSVRPVLSRFQSLTWKTDPSKGKLRDSPGTGGGHRSIFRHAASKLGSPFSKYSGEIKLLTCVNKLLNGNLDSKTTLCKTSNVNPNISDTDDTYFLKVTTGQRWIFDLPEIDIAPVIGGVDLQGGRTGSVVDQVLFA